MVLEKPRQCRRTGTSHSTANRNRNGLRAGSPSSPILLDFPDLRSLTSSEAGSSRTVQLAGTSLSYNATRRRKPPVLSPLTSILSAATSLRPDCSSAGINGHRERPSSMRRFGRTCRDSSMVERQRSLLAHSPQKRILSLRTAHSDSYRMKMSWWLPKTP